MSIGYLLHTLRGEFVTWWRNRTAVYYVFDPKHGTLQQQLERLVVAPGHRWRCRPRMIVADIQHPEHLVIPEHIDVLAAGGTYGSVVISSDSTMGAYCCAFGSDTRGPVIESN